MRWAGRKEGRKEGREEGTGVCFVKTHCKTQGIAAIWAMIADSG
jgi:hypothetical protein